MTGPSGPLLFALCAGGDHSVAALTIFLSNNGIFSLSLNCRFEGTILTHSVCHLCR